MRHENQTLQYFKCYLSHLSPLCGPAPGTQACDRVALSGKDHKWLPSLEVGGHGGQTRRGGSQTWPHSAGGGGRPAPVLGLDFVWELPHVSMKITQRKRGNQATCSALLSRDGNASEARGLGPSSCQLSGWPPRLVPGGTGGFAPFYEERGLAVGTRRAHTGVLPGKSGSLSQRPPAVMEKEVLTPMAL